MKKGFIILGGLGSGKTQTAKAIARNYKNSLFFDGRILPGPFYSARCDKHTDIIIIDDISKGSNFYDFYSFSHDGIEVSRQSKTPFIIYPDVIFTFRSDITRDQLPQRIDERFTIIDFNETA